jgi:tetratricopeptide (TPR) repeat protein
MLAAIRTTACAVALAATASLGPVQAQQSQARTWCTISEADGVSLDLRISGCTTVIQSDKVSNNDLAIAFYNRGNAYRPKGQHDRAIQDYDQAIKLNPNYALAYNNRGIAYGAKGQHDRAIQDFDQAIKLDPSYAKAFNNRGAAYRDKGQIDRAIQDFDQATRRRW